MINRADKEFNQLSVEELDELALEAAEVNLDPSELAPEVEAMHLANLERTLDDDTNSEESFDSLQDPSDATGGDVDVDPYLAEVVGEEAIGGTAPTPDQNVIEDIAASAGINTPEQGILHTTEMLEHRDSHRWELEPESSEDYNDLNS
jgi:hypothetical protein